MRRASSAALAAFWAAAALLACGGAASPGGGASPGAKASPSASPPASPSPPPGQAVAFRRVATTPQSGRTDPSPAVEAVRSASGLTVTAFQGQKNTGGHAIRVERVTLAGGELRVHALLSEPPPGAFVTQALTSPSETIEVEAFAPVVILLDQTGTERARTTVR